LWRPTEVDRSSGAEEERARSIRPSGGVVKWRGRTMGTLSVLAAGRRERMK
jgi:hypothetical protein